MTRRANDRPGPLALLGGAEWRPGAEDVDSELLARSGGGEVVVLPTAAAFERPEKAVATAERWFSRLGAKVRPLMVLKHEDALAPENARVVADAGFVYLGGGSPLHLRSVLKGTPVFEALSVAWHLGAVVAGSSAGAMVICDPMVDPRGGAFTVGLGLVEHMSVVPHHKPGGGHLMWRTLELAPADLPVAGVPEGTAVLRDGGTGWRSLGAAPEEVEVYVGGEIVGLEALPA